VAPTTNAPDIRSGERNSALSVSPTSQPERFKVIPPSPDIVYAFTNVEYSTEAAIADIIDNSIDADASHVLIRVVGTADRIDHLLIVDNGKGMSSETIDHAMSFGHRRPYGSNDLGLYGMGLKSASLSQSPVMTVFSRAKGDVGVGRQWSSEKAREGWRCGEMRRSECTAILGAPWVDGLATKMSGTVVRWDDVKRFRQATNRVDIYIKKFYAGLSSHLGMVYHRSLDRGTLRLTIDFWNTDLRTVGYSRSILPLDPFGYSISGDARYPVEFSLIHGSESLVATCHIWPKGRAADTSYKLIGNVAQRQGFYYYRNDRLIQAGGWNGLRMDGEPHLSLARVAVNLPKSSGDSFQVRYTKASVDVPQEFVDGLRLATGSRGASFSGFLDAAEEVYRSRGEQKVSKLHPVKGLPPKCKAAAGKRVGFKASFPFKIHEGRVKRGEVFDLDIERQQLTLNKKLLDRASSKELREALKVMSYLLFQDKFDTERMSAVRRETISAYSDIVSKVFESAEEGTE